MRYMNRREAADYLKEHHGIERSPETLCKYATTGGGPVYFKKGRNVVYTNETLDAYAARITKPMRSSSEPLSCEVA